MTLVAMCTGWLWEMTLVAMWTCEYICWNNRTWVTAGGVRWYKNVQQIYSVDDIGPLPLSPVLPAFKARSVVAGVGLCFIVMLKKASNNYLW